MRQDIGSNNWSESVVVVPPVSLITDTTINSNDKTIVVPDGVLWKIIFIRVLFASSSTSGNRLIVLRLLDPDSNIIYAVTAGDNQVANKNVHYNFMPGAPRDSTAVNSIMHIPLPQDLHFPAGYGVRVLDSPDVSGLDDMEVYIQALVYDV